MSGQVDPRFVRALSAQLEPKALGVAETDLAPRLCAAARQLATVDERVGAGDLVLTGLVVDAPLHSGDEVVAELLPLGRVGLSIG